MAERDEFRTISGRATASLKIQRSEFVAIAVPVESREDFDAALDAISRKHHDATHLCWAWRGLTGNAIEERSSDAGEPSGTAGKPILQSIESADLVNVGIVVVRYYGGIKLGTGGLARAYRDAAREVLKGTTARTILLCTRMEVIVPFDRLNIAYRLLAPPDVVLVEERYGDGNVFVIDVRESHRERIEKELEEKRLAYSVP